MNMEGTPFKYALKCIFNAHTADARIVKPTLIPDGGILTGSRDNSVKVWAPEGKFYKECQKFTGANAFIASLCVLPPSAQYPKGLFLAGSHDCAIYGFTLDSSEPILKLHGHSGAVCTLAYGHMGYFVSGSWDKTARVWSGQQCILTLQGHLEAVWATEVISTQNLILTASADRTIRLWRSGVCEKVFRGHEDCVRGLAVKSDTQFLSCSNDNTVRLWSTSGECLEVFKSHTDYIYSIALLNNGTGFVTCGEDQNIKIWRNGTCVQTIVISPKSLWSVTCLTDGSLAVGTSDGKVYVFEKVHPEFFERPPLPSLDSVQSRDIGAGDFIPAVSDIAAGDFEGDFIPAVPDVKFSIYDGEVVVMYEVQSDQMYVCQYHSTAGTKVEKKALNFQFIECTFYKKAEKGASGSQSYLKEKDYVFDVDVENTMYKLAFNKGENPWEVANKFVGDHNLPNDHIGQIVDYIIKNTVTTFTNEHFPVKTFFTYLNVNLNGLRNKLIEFSEKVPNEKKITESEIDELMLLAHYAPIVSVEQMVSLDKAISWSDELLFPVLDLLRVGVQCKGLRAKVSSKEFVNHLLHIFMNTEKSVNRVLVEKILCNMFGIDEAEEALMHFQDKIFESLKEKFVEQNIHKAGSALLLNFAIASYNGFNLNTHRYCMTIVDILVYLNDSQAIFRVLVAIGTACTRNTLAVTYFRSMNIKEYILKFADNQTAEIGRVVELLCSDF